MWLSLDCSLACALQRPADPQHNAFSFIYYLNFSMQDVLCSCGVSCLNTAVSSSGLVGTDVLLAVPAFCKQTHAGNRDIFYTLWVNKDKCK